MKPPICEVCSDRFSPRDGALITCVGDARSAAWHERQAEAPFPGHAPDKGWFCPSHRARAEELAVALTLAQVVEAMRAG